MEQTTILLKVHEKIKQRYFDKKLKRQFQPLIEALTGPLIVMPGGWHDTIPEWLKGEVTLQRMIQLMKGEEGIATDVEALVYMYTASLVTPFNESWTNVYLHLGKTVMETKGRKIPDRFIQEVTLTDYQQDLLTGLKKWLWKQRTKRRR